MENAIIKIDYNILFCFPFVYTVQQNFLFKVPKTSFMQTQPLPDSKPFRFCFTINF